MASRNLGYVEEWYAEITEQDPDKRISWKSTSGPFNAGSVRFEALDTHRTRVRLAMAYEAQDTLANIGHVLGIFDACVRNILEDFKHFTEARYRETGAWRGHVKGQTQARE